MDRSKNQELTEAVASAISNTLGGSFVDGFAGIVNYIDEDGDRRFFFVWPEEQFFDRTLSMVDHLHAYCREVQRLNIVDMLIDLEDDDAD